LLKIGSWEGHLHYVQKGKLHNEEHQEGYLLRVVNLGGKAPVSADGQLQTKFGWANLQILNSSDYQGGSSFRTKVEGNLGISKLEKEQKHCNGFVLLYF